MVEKSQNEGFWPSIYDPFRSLGTRVADWLTPATEAKGSNEAYSIRMELPGVDEKEIHLSVEDGVVTVRGEKRTEKEEKGDTWYFSERQYGAFRRSFRLPADADASGVTAEMKDGVLTVTVPKTKPSESQKSKRIEIAKG